MQKSKKEQSDNKNTNLEIDNFKGWSDYINTYYSHCKKIDESNEKKVCRNVRPTWNEMYMEIAEIVAKRSKDPHTKVGAVIVKDNHILGIGYNAEPKGFSYDFDWHSSEKYDYVIHAELNAIANSTYFGNSIAGSSVYLTLSPCHECMKLLIQYGISTVYYKDKYKDFELTEKMAKYSNIKLIRFNSR